MAEHEGTPASRPVLAVAPPPLAALSLSLSPFASSSPVVEVVVPAAERESGKARRLDRNLRAGAALRARGVARTRGHAPGARALPVEGLRRALHSCLFCDFGCHAAAKAPSCSPVATRGEETGMRRGGEGRGIRG
uniref:Uncharacterized protein n=1 Tax=Oryza barthii TaxID=65489 RepID=A0A0D3GY27_9ORYZ